MDLEEEKQIIHHFSHRHPLESSICSSPTGKITCNGCSLAIFSGKDYYDCKTCSFSLHRVCSSMPRKTRHPSHPNHHLTLLVSLPSITCKCMACGENVSAFYYSCSECSVYYHILCAALPLSIAILSHPHTLKIEFLPPYDFSCDLCDKPSSLGWLYRCRFCEFDAHISCAISNQRTKHVPLANTLTRQIIYSSASIMEMNRLIDYGVESNELMQLVVQGITNHEDGNGSQEVAGTALTGWTERLRSPQKKIENGNVSHMSSNLVSIDQSTPVSEELSTIASYQFSDMCFSIDLMKSSSSQAQKSQAKEDIEKAVPETEEKIPGKFEEQHNKPVFNPLYKAPENWLNEVSLLADGKLGQNQENMKPQVKDQRIKSNSARWWKLINCCFHSSYQQCSKSFKNGGL